MTEYADFGYSGFLMALGPLKTFLADSKVYDHPYRESNIN